MASFAGIEFKVQAVNSYMWPGLPRTPDSPIVWSATVTVDTRTKLNNLINWWTTLDSRRGLKMRTWTHIVKAGPGASTLIVPGSGGGPSNLVTRTNVYLTRIEWRGDAWREGRYFVDVEFTLT